MNTTATKTSPVVMLAVNDEGGKFSGECEALEITDVIRLDGMGGPVVVEFIHDEGTKNAMAGVLIVEAERYRYQHYRYWVGNWCWDAMRMTVDDVARLLEQLRAMGWSYDEAEEGVAEAWDSGEPLAPALAKAVADGSGQ